MAGRGSFDILACQTCDSSDNTGDPRVTDCHLFLAVSFSLFDFGQCDPAQVLFTVRRSTPLSPITNSNTGNRKADRNPTPWELANAKFCWPFGYRFEIPNAEPWMQEKNDHVALTCAKVVNKDEDRPSRRTEGGEGRGRWKSIMYLIVESLPGLDLQ